MWQPYLRVIRKRCGEGVHGLDPFHIVAKKSKALDDVRAGPRYASRPSQHGLLV